ncbi:hypothetical protein [Rhodococcus wratislaviensis]|uniref:hypothetical protein n=1 Tax=Rhodococcus wratislaviensis TaxID=44752 RepID=UPI00364FB7C5
MPSPATRMFVKHTLEYEPTPAEQHVLKEQRLRQRTTAGPAAKYPLESLRLDEPSTVRGGSGSFSGRASDDVIAFVSPLTSAQVRTRSIAAPRAVRCGAVRMTID